jgi:gliding motility-associated-like protein
VWIPNAFSPDVNGLNDVFKPTFPAPVSNYYLQIWNRWGLRVFESKKSSIGWNGKYKDEPQPTAVYVYLITLLTLMAIT